MNSVGAVCLLLVICYFPAQPPLKRRRSRKSNDSSKLVTSSLRGNASTLGLRVPSAMVSGTRKGDMVSGTPGGDVVSGTREGDMVSGTPDGAVVSGTPDGDRDSFVESIRIRCGIKW